MAYNPNEQFQSAAGLGSQKRVEPRTIQPKTFASGSGTLAALTPVAFNTSTNFWVLWDSDGVNDTAVIRGFVWSDEVVLDSDEEVLGNVLMEGKIHYDDIVLPAGEDEADLKAALRGADANGLTMRDKGLVIQGLDQVH